MSKSDNCKKLLADWFKGYLPTDMSAYDFSTDGTEEEQQESAWHLATNPKSWKRLSKIEHTSPLFCDYIGKKFEIQTRDGSGNITSDYKSPECFKTERVFVCSPDKLDSSLRYVIVEDFKGNLFLANEIGD